MSTEDEIAKLQAANAEILNEGGPRLTYLYNTWDVVWCPTHQSVMRGGLGGLGNGKMWRNLFPEETIEDTPERCCEDHDDFGYTCLQCWDRRSSR